MLARICQGHEQVHEKPLIQQSTVPFQTVTPMEASASLKFTFFIQSMKMVSGTYDSNIWGVSCASPDDRVASRVLRVGSGY